MDTDILYHPSGFKYSTIVQPEWIDYNQHMRDAYYSLVFSFAVDQFQEEIGLSAAYRKLTQNTLYALEFHNYFIREVKKGDALDIATIILANDYKRIHLYQMMFSEKNLVATCESMQLHVSQIGTPAAKELPEYLYQELKGRNIESEISTQLKHRSRLMGFNNKNA